MLIVSLNNYISVPAFFHFLFFLLLAQTDASLTCPEHYSNKSHQEVMIRLE